jgi:hypothetical protein
MNTEHRIRVASIAVIPLSTLWYSHSPVVTTSWFWTPKIMSFAGFFVQFESVESCAISGLWRSGRTKKLVARKGPYEPPGDPDQGTGNAGAAAERLSRKRRRQPCEPDFLSTLATLRRDSANAQFLHWDFPVRKSQEQEYIFRRDRSSQLLSGAAQLQEIAGE